MNYKEHPWMGVFPATLCAFGEDESIDEEGLRSYVRDLCTVEGLKGLVCNGHTGEIVSLRPKERAEVTRIFAEEVKKSGRGLKVVSGISAEGSLEAIDDALAGKSFDMGLMDQLESLSNRGYTEGFYRRHVPGEFQNYETGHSLQRLATINKYFLWRSA